MNPHLAEDMDDENVDDPIRLFGNDLKVIFFGSKPLGPSTLSDSESLWRLEAIGNGDFCQPEDNSTLGKPDGDQLENKQSGTTSECDITPSSVKLVDCGKFPWYFGKYTQQIIHKINSNENSDSDQYIDVEVVDDSDDCFIIEDLKDITHKIITNDQLCMKTVKSSGLNPKMQKSKLNKTLEIIKRRKDDEEINRALSIKQQQVQVDLKRNQGLIGMKIVQKVELNKTLVIKADTENVVEKAEEKEQSIMADKKYVSAADKTLSRVGTQLIPIIEEKERSSICQFPNEDKDLIDKPTFVNPPISQNVNVQFDLSKIPEKLIDNLKAKKTYEQSSNTKVISQSNKSLLKNPGHIKEIANEEELSSKAAIPEKYENSSTKVTSHVKTVKNTNKHKKYQNKIDGSSSHSSLVGLLVTNKSKGVIKELKCKKQKSRSDGKQNINTKLVKKPRKKIEKQKPELKSPILHCSTKPKKTKYDMPPKCNKPDTISNVSKEIGKLNKIVDKLTNLNSCNLVKDSNRPKPIIFPRVTPKNWNVRKKIILKEPSAEGQSQSIDLNSLNVSDILPKNCNDVKKSYFSTSLLRNTQIITSSQNKTLNEQSVLREPYENNEHKRKTSSVTVTNPTHKAPFKNNKPTACNSNVKTTSESESVPFIKYPNFPTSHGPHLPIQNAVHTKMSTSNIPHKNVNVPVQNRCASAIILKSNNHTNFPFEKYCQSPVQSVTQRTMTVLSQAQPQCRDPPPPYPVFYPPAPSAGNQGYFPSSINCVPNQYHPLQGHIAQYPSNPMKDFYTKCWLPQNVAAPPPPTPPPVPPHKLPRIGQNVNQSNDCSNLNRPITSIVQNSQSGSHQNFVSTVQANNGSIIGMNNDGLVKKINIVAMPVQNNVKNNKIGQIQDSRVMSPVEDSEIVDTKMKMLKELDKLSFVDGDSFEQEMYPASVINETKKENALQVPIMSNKPGRFDSLKLTMNSKDKPLQTPVKGYSPPILPIPTYQKILDGVNLNPLAKNSRPKIDPRLDPRLNSKSETKTMNIKDFGKSCKRKINNACNNDGDSKRKEDAKKISLDEYKKRTMKNFTKSKNNAFKEKNKNRKNVDYRTETDLGYDSDSTVVL